jgi:hypothetical protein
MIAAIVGLCATVAGLLGWIGSRINVRLEKIGETLALIERDLRGELFGLDRRITKLEAYHHETHNDQ